MSVSPNQARILKNRKRITIKKRKNPWQIGRTSNCEQSIAKQRCMQRNSQREENKSGNLRVCPAILFFSCSSGHDFIMKTLERIQRNPTEIIRWFEKSMM